MMFVRVPYCPHPSPRRGRLQKALKLSGDHSHPYTSRCAPTPARPTVHPIGPTPRINLFANFPCQLGADHRFPLWTPGRSSQIFAIPASVAIWATARRAQSFFRAMPGFRPRQWLRFINHGRASVSLEEPCIYPDFAAAEPCSAPRHRIGEWGQRWELLLCRQTTSRLSRRSRGSARSISCISPG